MIGRPQTTEAAPNYFTYVNQVTGDDPLAAIDTQLDESLALFAGISEEKSLHRYAPEKWSIRQGLNPLSDNERAFVFRALWSARGFDAPLPGYDQDIAAASSGADSVSWADHVAEFRADRLSTISLFRNMPPEAWLRTGIANDNPLTVRALAFIIPGHVTHHIKLPRERYL